MKILVVLPNWLGDAVMATPAIELLVQRYKDAEITFVGSYVSIEALKYHPNMKKAIIDNTKKAKSRLLATYKLAKELGSFDIAITFRNQIHSSLLLYFTNSKITIARASWHSKLLLTNAIDIKKDQHLVKQYASLVMQDIKDYNIGSLKIYIEPTKYKNKTLGINAGATYGSAKRWYPDRFAKVATYFSSEYDIVIFGGPNEVEVANDIEKYLLDSGVKNYTNLAGKTDIKQLCANIAACSLFVTNDSGPMHIAAAYAVPTVAIFGPTKDKETSQWANKKSKIVRHNIDCAPCMKRECPLKHHKCMKSIEANEVIEALKTIINN